jgi:hypothetical protein
LPANLAGHLIDTIDELNSAPGSAPTEDVFARLC